MEITIRKAVPVDRDGVLRLLSQIAEFHRSGRPDLFKEGSAKYSKEEFEKILADENKPVFVAVDEKGEVCGYIFCKIMDCKKIAVFNDYISFFIEDFCVDENVRGQHIGKRLFEYAKEYAKKIGAYNITLHVWEFNEGAKKFYESCGMEVQRRIMEFII